MMRCSVRKVVLRNFTKVTGKHLCQGLFLNKEIMAQVNFPVNSVKFLRTSFSQNTSWRLLFAGYEAIEIGIYATGG